MLQHYQSRQTEHTTAQLCLNADGPISSAAVFVDYPVYCCASEVTLVIIDTLIAVLTYLLTYNHY